MTAILPNFPMKDQRSEKTADSRPPENAPYDCVPVAFAAAIQYYRGGYVSGDELKDAEYGETYANAGTALRRYVDDATDLARAKYHVTAVPFNSTDTRALTAKIHALLQAGFPVIATIPSQWGTAHDMTTLASSPFSTHVVCFYSEEGGLTAMNPWGGFAHTGSDAYWQGRLCDGQIWQIEKEVEAVNVSTIPTGWKDDGATLTASNGVPVVKGFREKVLGWPGGWAANNTPMAAEKAITSGSIEPGNLAIGPGSRQDFRFCSLGWTQATGVYVIAVGQDIVALANQAESLQQHITLLLQANQQLAGELATAKANMNPTAAQLVTALKAALAS